MVAQITKIEHQYAAPDIARRKLRVFITYDGSETAEATLTGLSRAGLSNEVEALVAVTDVWLPLSPREITRTGIEDGELEEVVLLKSRESSVDCVFIDPHYGRTDVFDGSGLGKVAAAVVLGAQCSVEVVRANNSNNQYLEPAA